MYACTYVDHQFLFYTPPGVPEDANLTIESRFIQLKKVDSFDMFSHIHTYIHTHSNPSGYTAIGFKEVATPSTFES
jgi:hypothetical protein